MVKDRFFGVCHDCPLEAHAVELLDCAPDLIGCFTGAELLVEGGLENAVQDWIPVDIEQGALARLAKEG